MIFHMAAMDPGRRMLGPSIPHYYGDVVRILMLCGAGLMLVGLPLGSPAAPLPVVIIMAVIAVGFAALTNPWKQWVIIADVFACAAIAVWYELLAVSAYEIQVSVGFVVGEAIAILYLIAFYFALKTLRAMMLHQVGKPDSLREFGRTQTEPDPLQGEKSFNPNLMGD